MRLTKRNLCNFICCLSWQALSSYADACTGHVHSETIPKHALSTTAPLRPLGSGKSKGRHMRGALREQNLEDALPKPCFTPAAVMVHDSLPRPLVCGQLPPGRGRPSHPEHGLHASAPLLCLATSLGLCELEQRAQLVPEGIGEQRKHRQGDGRRQRVRQGDGRSLTGPALGVRPLRAGLMCAAETRPPHEVRALLLCRLDPAQESAHFCQAQVEPGGRTRAFFSRAWWRTTQSTACAKRANVMNRYQARYVRTSY